MVRGLSVIALFALLLCCSPLHAQDTEPAEDAGLAQIEEEQAAPTPKPVRDPGVFGKGRVRASFILGAGSAFGNTYLLLGVGVSLLEPDLDLASSFSAALACMGNIGPAFGDAGPMGSYAHFGDTTKVVLALAMWIGRLEIVTVIALLTPEVWKHARWGRRPSFHARTRS